MPDAPAWTAPPGERSGDHAPWDMEWCCPHCGELEAECICYDEPHEETDDGQPNA